MATMSKDQTEYINGGSVTRLQAWPKPILGADGQPKRRGVAASTEAPEKPADPEPRGGDTPDGGDGGGQVEKPARTSRGRS